jgi:hypothetical protein
MALQVWRSGRLSHPHARNHATSSLARTSRLVSIPDQNNGAPSALGPSDSSVTRQSRWPVPCSYGPDLLPRRHPTIPLHLPVPSSSRCAAHPSAAPTLGTSYPYRAPIRRITCLQHQTKHNGDATSEKVYCNIRTKATATSNTRCKIRKKKLIQ